MHLDLQNSQHSRRSAEELHRIAEAVFPDWQVLPSLDDLESKFPHRDLPDGAMVTRVCPSPTGMMHLGGLYTAMINQRLARQTGGLFYLRIEDTDQRRSVEGALETIIDSMAEYSLNPAEGPYRDTDGRVLQRGDYGPYIQTERKRIYRAVAFQMMCSGHLYPCFLAEDEIDAIREDQRSQNLRPGIYGHWAEPSRSLSVADIQRAIGDGKTFVLRLYAPPQGDSKVFWEDAIRGSMSMPENFMDNVLIKSDGIPTYHFAHMVDDHLMRTTHVIRADEWIPSVPLHLQLHDAIGWRPPVYGHIAAIYKQHNGSKRKLSKRSDPEANVEYYWQEGFPREAVLEYLTNLANSAFEDWRAAHPDAHREVYQLSLQGMSLGGPLSDLDKLRNVSRNLIARFTGRELLGEVLAWTRRYEPRLATAVEEDEDYAIKALEVHRVGADDSKRLLVLADVRTHLAPFFDDWLPPVDQLPFPDDMSGVDREEILRAVVTRYDDSIESAAVFPMLQSIAQELGYAPTPKAYKKAPDEFSGHVGDVAMVVRVTLFGSRQSPDLGKLMTTLGSERVRRRIQRVLRA